ncbi:TPA: hypothetical protein OXC77_003795 [Enterobacter roggenkampii]|uniref:hypothetical protein n=1 Tax=Enterobacter roggenkampii TaxID=1812935 RepID=UPI00228894E0|nr:hypothetical protein [Enterobacter roggenkampii]
MIRKGLLLTLVFILTSYVFIAFSHKFIPSSDSMSGILESADIAYGNLTLKGWYLSTVNFYFTDLIWYALAIKIFGYEPWITYIIPGIMAGSLVTASCALGTKKSIRNIWPIFLFMAVPGAMISYMLSVAIIHVPTYSYIVITYIFLEKYCKSEEKKYLIPAIFISSLTVYSDDITTYLLFVPLTLACLFSKEKIKIRVFVFASLIISFAIYKAILHLTSSSDFFFLPGIGKPVFVTYEKLAFNLSLLFQGVLVLFDANFFGKLISSPEGFFAALKFVVGASFFYFLYKSTKKSCALSLIEIAILVAAMIMIPAYAISDKPVDLGTTRYLIPVTVFGSILICRGLDISERKNNIFISLTVITSLISLFYINKPDFTFEVNRNTDKYSAISDYLYKHKLQNGYATFWNASAVSKAHIFNIGPINIDTNSKKITASFWLSKTANFNNGNNFFIVDNEQQLNLIKYLYGNPIAVEKIYDTIVITYGTPIALDIGSIKSVAGEINSSFDVNSKGEICNNGNAGYVAFGPYKDIGAGHYILKINATGDDYILDIYSYITNVKINISNKSALDGYYNVTLPVDIPSAEVRLFAKNGTNVCFKSYSFERVR